MFNEENAYPENCDKCRKPKFNAKHPIYCEEKCNIILVSVSGGGVVTMLP